MVRSPEGFIKAGAGRYHVKGGGVWLLRVGAEWHLVRVNERPPRVLARCKTMTEAARFYQEQVTP